jgi:hypothetical protein
MVLNCIIRWRWLPLTERRGRRQRQSGKALNTGRSNPAARASVDPEKDLAGVGEPRAVDRIPMTARVRQAM